MAVKACAEISSEVGDHEPTNSPHARGPPPLSIACWCPRLRTHPLGCRRTMAHGPQHVLLVLLLHAALVVSSWHARGSTSHRQYAEASLPTFLRGKTEFFCRTSNKFCRGSFSARLPPSIVEPIKCSDAGFPACRQKRAGADHRSQR